MNIPELQRWFETHVVTKDGKRYVLDDEQAAVVLDEHKNTLVTARAGSGKTYTLVAKMIYLMEFKQILPHQMMALVFNKSAAEEIRTRLAGARIDGKPIFDDETNPARTFDSLAYHLTEDTSILYDDKEYCRSEYIGKIVEKVIDPKEIYTFIRDNVREPQPENYANYSDYLMAAKHSHYDTLNGETVKSLGEKIIADFLFEHGVPYRYEGIEFYPKKLARYAKDDEMAEELLKYDVIKPDFYLPEQKLFWEHWGISGDETKAQIAEINQKNVIGKYEEYDAKKQFKEWFYGREWLDSEKIATKEAKNDQYLQKFLEAGELIFTNYTRGEEREDFEQKIKTLLNAQDISCEKLPMEVLLTKFRDETINLPKMQRRVRDFIDRAEQQFPGNYTGLERACQRLQIRRCGSSTRWR